jgi:Uma2 family endonuclease
MNNKQRIELENSVPQVIVEVVNRLRSTSIPMFRKYNDYQTAMKIRDLLGYEIARYEREYVLENTKRNKP